MTTNVEAAERAVLGAMLKDATRVPDVRAALDWRDFYQDAHQLVCRACFELADEGGAVDAVTVGGRLTQRGWLDHVGTVGEAFAFLASLADACPSPAAAGEYAAAVKRESKRRALLFRVGRLAEMGADRRVPLEDLQMEAARVAAGDVAAGAKQPAPFPTPITASSLKTSDPAGSWVLEGILRRGEVTLMPALWKSGKTTLLAHMLRAFAAGGRFLGLQAIACRVLYVTEESEGRWAMRRDAVGIADHVDFLIRPFATKPNVQRWEEFLSHVGGLIVPGRYDVVVFDTLANLWPLRDENDAASVQACLMPMHRMIEDRAALQLVHHTRKSDGTEATASRGSGALTGFVDTIIEFRRYLPGDRKDRRRVLSGYGRHDETPQELVIELTEQGYVSRGDREAVSTRDLSEVIRDILPPRAPGLTADQVGQEWPADSPRPGEKRLMAALKDGADGGSWTRTGQGKRGSPYLFFMPPHDDSVSVLSPYRENGETETGSGGAAAEGEDWIPPLDEED